MFPSRHQDPAWLAQLHVARRTSQWRQYYHNACLSAGFPNPPPLFLTPSFNPHSQPAADSAYENIIRGHTASSEDTKSMVFSVSYDHDESGKMNSQTWTRLVAMLRQMCEPDVCVLLWIDKVDAKQRSGLWGIWQLLPYVTFPVLRVGNRPDAGFWSNMEGMAGIFGRGLYHDQSLSPAVVQYFSPVVGKDFFASRAATFNAGDALYTFYVHLMFGTLAQFRNHHQEALKRLSLGATVYALTANPNTWLEIILGYERNSMYDPGRFEIINGFECRTDIPRWHGLKEWITPDRFAHPVFDPTDVVKFNINGFANIYEGKDKTAAMVHWYFPSSEWTRRLLVHLSYGSREEGTAISHLRVPGYRNGDESALERESILFQGLDLVYTFDSMKIGWK